MVPVIGWVFFSTTHRRKTACVFAYVLFIVGNLYREASTSFGSSAAASTGTSAFPFWMPNYLILGTSPGVTA